MQPNELTIFNELTGSGKDLYSDEKTDFRVSLYNSTGEELQGIYEYIGSQTGEIRSGEIITLAGNEFVTINPGNIYKNVRYKVERIEDGSQKVSQSGIRKDMRRRDWSICSIYEKCKRYFRERNLHQGAEVTCSRRQHSLRMMFPWKPTSFYLPWMKRHPSPQ